jgi:hypothetical protein
MADDDDGFDIDPDMLARAERAVAALSKGYADALAGEIAAMRAALAGIVAGGGTDSVDSLFQRGHDMAGQGGSFGFPLLSRLGRSLCDVIRGRGPDFSADDIDLLHDHVAVAAAIVDGSAEGEALVAGLEARSRA